MRQQHQWIIALLPIISASLYRYGADALNVLCLCLFTSVLFDAGTNLIIKSKDNTSNWTSVPMAILLAVLLPVGTPWWMVVIGSGLMIILGKKLFGGIGAYPVHPVLLSYAMLQISWPATFKHTGAVLAYDWNISMVSPLQMIKTLGASAETIFSWQDMLLGNQVAGLGNGLVLFVLIGGILLLLMRTITWHIPVAFIIGVVCMGGLLRLVDPQCTATPIFHLLSASTLLGAFFLAPEPTTSPVNSLPMIMYGLLGGALLVLIRTFSIHLDGIAFTILLINMVYPLLDRITPAVRGLEVADHA